MNWTSSTWTKLIAALLIAVLIVGCGSTEEKLVGTWVAESVDASIDSTAANPSDLAKIEHAINTQKTISFTLNEDHSMSLTIDNYVSEAIWSFDSDSDAIKFRFKDSDIDDFIDLGTYDGGEILYTSGVIHGTLTTVYVKE